MKNIFLALSLVSLAACNSNPYPKDGEISNKPERDSYAVRPALGIDAPDLMRFEEGLEGEYRITVKVPTGDPVMVWEGLPTGAAFDATRGAMVWKPDFAAANDINNPAVKTREYPVTLILSSTTDVVTSIRKSMLLQVHDTPRPVTVTGLQDVYRMNEGESKELARIEVASDDFASRELRLQLKNATPGLIISNGDRAGEYVLKAQYAFNQVRVGSNCSSSWNCEASLKDALIAIAPDGRQVEKEFEVKLKDVRQNVSLSISRVIDVTGDLLMGFTAVDNNQEVAPLVRITKSPDVGMFEIKKMTTENLLATSYESSYQLSWSLLPPEAVGQTYSAQIEACNSSQSSSPNTSSCRTIDLSLKVLPREVTAPTIARGDWTQGVMKYLKLEKQTTFRVDVNAGRRELRILSLSAVSSDSADEVSLVGNNLKIKALKPGVKTVTVNVTNSIGGVASAVFLYEVLPANWSENVVLASASPVAELAPLEVLLKESNRSYFGGQNLDGRALAFRKTITAGTHSMKLPDIATDLNFFAKNLKQVLISTPLLSQLPADIISELRQHGVYLAGRASADASFKLADFEMIPTRRLGMPKEAVKLIGTTTSESFDPALLSMTISSDCERLYSLFKPTNPPQELLIGVACPREGGGRLVVLGFEWADLKLAEADADMTAQWFKKMME